MTGRPTEPPAEAVVAEPDEVHEAFAGKAFPETPENDERVAALLRFYDDEPYYDEDDEDDTMWGWWDGD